MNQLQQSQQSKAVIQHVDGYDLLCSSERPAAASQQTVVEQKTEPAGVVEMTLDEYKAKMVVSRSKPQYQERVVSENGSGNQWKDSVVFSRNEDEYIPSQRVRSVCEN